MTHCWIALGSNLADPEQQLLTAIRSLQELPDSQVLQVSSIYSSSPLGPADQPDYLNAVLELETSLEPLPLLDALQAIESAQGRERTQRWGPRTIDLDILLYGDLIIDLERLQVPHAGMAARNFVLYPLAELTGPKLVLPDGRELGTLLARCPRGDLRQIARRPGDNTGN